MKKLTRTNRIVIYLISYSSNIFSFTHSQQFQNLTFVQTQWIKINGTKYSMYYLDPDYYRLKQTFPTVSYKNAAEMCKSIGGQLGMPKTGLIHDLFKSWMEIMIYAVFSNCQMDQNNRIKYSCNLDQIRWRSSAFIGMKQRYRNSTNSTIHQIWNDGSAVENNEWLITPGYTKQDCVAYRNFQWDVVSCDNRSISGFVKLGFFCERQIQTTLISMVRSSSMHTTRNTVTKQTAMHQNTSGTRSTLQDIYFWQIILPVFGGIVAVLIIFGYNAVCNKHTKENNHNEGHNEREKSIGLESIATKSASSNESGESMRKLEVATKSASSNESSESMQTLEDEDLASKCGSITTIKSDA